MDIILAIIAAVIIGAASMVTAVGVGIGCYSYGSMYKYRTNEAEIRQIKHELVESRENYADRWENYVNVSLAKQSSMKNEYNLLKREITRITGGK